MALRRARLSPVIQGSWLSGCVEPCDAGPVVEVKPRDAGLVVGMVEPHDATGLQPLRA